MLMSNKNVLICGIASTRSIAYSVATAMQREGANIFLTYPSDTFKDRLIKMFPDLPMHNLFLYDAKNDSDLVNIKNSFQEKGIKIDSIVHSIAFAEQSQIKGLISDNIDKDKFLESLQISAYSFPAMIKHLKSEFNPNASALTFSYIGSQRAVPNYNVMGLAKACLETSVTYLAKELGPQGFRVNCISAGPIKTLAAAGIKGFKNMLKYDEITSPLPGNTTTDEVADAAVFMSSHMSRGITGQTLYVDHGFHVTAFPGESE